MLNGDIKIDTKSTSSFSIYPIKISHHKLFIYQLADNKYDLKCANSSFDELYRNNSQVFPKPKERKSLFVTPQFEEPNDIIQISKRSIIYNETETTYDENESLIGRKSYVTDVRLPRYSVDNTISSDRTQQLMRAKTRFKRGKGPAHVVTEDSFDDQLKKEEGEKIARSWREIGTPKNSSPNPFEFKTEKSEAVRKIITKDVDLLDFNAVEILHKNVGKSQYSTEISSVQNNHYSHNPSMYPTNTPQNMASMMAYDMFMTNSMSQYQNPNPFQK